MRPAPLLSERASSPAARRPRAAIVAWGALAVAVVVTVTSWAPGPAEAQGARVAPSTRVAASMQVTPGPTGPVTIAVREIRPFAYRTGRGWSGYSIDMWEQAAKELGLEYRYVEVATVTDQIAAVTSGRTQAALGAISITAERSKVVEFSQPMFDSGLQILVRDEGDDGGVARILAGLFTRTFLIVVAGLLVLLLIAGHVIWLVERRRNDHFPRRYLPGVWEGVWWAMVTMATVGYGDTVVRTRTGRVIAMFWMVAGLVLVAQFTAFVTSSLTVERINNDISNIGDLYGRPVATVADTAAARYLSDIDLPARGLADVQDATAALSSGTVDAVVYDSPVLRYYARTAGRNRTQVVGPLYQPQGYGMAFTAGSPLVGPVDEQFLVEREDGTAAALQERYLG